MLPFKMRLYTGQLDDANKDMRFVVTGCGLDWWQRTFSRKQAESLRDLLSAMLKADAIGDRLRKRAG